MKSIPKTAVVVFTIDPHRLNTDSQAEMSAWGADEYEDSNTIEADIPACTADIEGKLEELFGKGLTGWTLFDEDDLAHMAKRFRKPRSFLTRLLNAGRP